MKIIANVLPKRVDRLVFQVFAVKYVNCFLIMNNKNNMLNIIMLLLRSMITLVLLLLILPQILKKMCWMIILEGKNNYKKFFT